MVNIDLREVDLEYWSAESSRQTEKLRRQSIYIRLWNGVAQVLYILLFVPRLFTLVVFFGYFLKCATLEKATIANCTQEFLVSNPKIWVMCWKVISMISSFTLIFIIWCNREHLNYSFYRSLIRLCKKRPFWWTNCLFAATFLYYVVRIDGSDLGMSIVLLLWWPVTLLVVFCLNYLPPVWFPRRNDKDLHAVCIFLGYWFTLFVYCAENFCMVCAVTLAAARKLTPLIEDDKYLDNRVEVVVLLFLWLRVAFNACLFSFFWNKIFNGSKDLFSERREKLEKQAEQLQQRNDFSELEERYI